MSIDDPQFAAQVRAGEPAAPRTVVHAYLGQILLRHMNLPQLTIVLTCLRLKWLLIHPCNQPSSYPVYVY